jgi:hypothetical protein
MDKLYIYKTENQTAAYKPEIFAEVNCIPFALYGVLNIASHPIVSGGIKCSTAMD